MKKNIILFIILSTIIFAETFEEMSLNQYNKAVYEMEKKSPSGAVVGSLLLPSLGHAYAGDWGRGLKFLGGEALAYYVMCLGMISYNDTYMDGNQNDLYYDNKSADTMMMVGFFSLVAIRIWEHVDAYKTAKNYNSNLYKRITLKPIASQNDNSAGLQLKYSF